MTDLTLYGERNWDSPYVFSVFVALKEKGLAFEEVELDLGAGDHRKAEYAARSLTSRVPALRHGDFWLSESTAIVEYLDESFPTTPLLPASPRDRARARQLLGWIRSDLGSLRKERSTETMFFVRATAPLSDAARADAEKLVRVASALLPAGRISLFDRWSIADADLAFALHRLILNGDPVPDAIHAFATAQRDRPSVRAFFEHARPPRPV